MDVPSDATRSFRGKKSRLLGVGAPQGVGALGVGAPQEVEAPTDGGKRQNPAKKSGKQTIPKKVSPFVEEEEKKSRPGEESSSKKKKKEDVTRSSDSNKGSHKAVPVKENANPLKTGHKKKPVPIPDGNRVSVRETVLPTASTGIEVRRNRSGLPVETDILTEIRDTYNDDYNILYVDDIIRKKLKYEATKEPAIIKAKIEGLEKAIAEPQYVIQRLQMTEQIDRLKVQLGRLIENKVLEDYIRESSPYISAYKQLKPLVKKIVFGKTIEETQTETWPETLRRLSIIDKYLNIAKNYIKIDVFRSVPVTPDVCLFCGESIDRMGNSDDGVIRCLNCLTEHSSMILTKTTKDNGRITAAPSMSDDSIENFLRAFNRYMGLQDKPPEELYTMLDAYFKSCGRPTGADIRQLPLNRRGRRGDTNHKMLINALSQIGRTEYYEDINLIGHIYWGWLLPDVMHLRETIIEDYNETQKIFHQIPLKERGRESSLATQYRLFRHLQLCGYDCKIEEFKIAENATSLRLHHQIWKKICDQAKNPRYRYIE